jgi:EAL domain-containing protein (putative c-di-GMP-specific phosphodiesterase class I)
MHEEEKNLTPPGAFIPYLEYYDMMPRLDRWVLDHALQWWQSKGAGAPALNVNLSAETLVEPSFPGFVGQHLGNAGMRGEALYFEVEAAEIASHAEKSRGAADKLRALGCRVAVTGFGRDLVSFEALKTVSAGMVKVDGGLVRELHRDPVSHARMKSIQGVCVKAGIQTVAEFVEEPQTMEILRGIGVSYAQGYGVGRPEALA